MSREQVLDRLDTLATVEHALCVEYLTIESVLAPVFASGPSADRIREAAETAFGTALREMGHLHRLNEVLTLARRRPQVGRASRIERLGRRDLVLLPPGGTNLEQLLHRNRLIAEAVDDAYEQLRVVVQAPEPLFEDELLEALTFVLDPGPDHREPVARLGDLLDGISAADYLRTTRREPANAQERSLLHLADLHYNLIVATVRAWFEHAAELEGELRGRALSAMDGAQAANALLIERGLLPAFTLDGGGDDEQKEAAP